LAAIRVHRGLAAVRAGVGGGLWWGGLVHSRARSLRHCAAAIRPAINFSGARPPRSAVIDRRSRKSSTRVRQNTRLAALSY
jgi:hypothetical protein